MSARRPTAFLETISEKDVDAIASRALDMLLDAITRQRDRRKAETLRRRNEEPDFNELYMRAIRLISEMDDRKMDLANTIDELTQRTIAAEKKAARAVKSAKA